MQPTARTVGVVAGFASGPSSRALRRTILGVPVDALSRREALERLAVMFEEPRFHHVVTVNPEFVMSAQRDEAFRRVLTGADVALCDGSGVQWATSFLGGQKVSVAGSLVRFLFAPSFRRRAIPERITGADLLADLFRFAAGRGFGVTLLHRSDSLSSVRGIEQTVRSRWPTLRLTVLSVPAGTAEPSDALTSAVARSASTVLLSDLGAPAQDRLVASLGPRTPTVRIGLGIGGSLDFLTGAIRRAPSVLRALGLEWLWRFVIEPKRFPRIVTATLSFIRAVAASRRTV